MLWNEPYGMTQEFGVPNEKCQPTMLQISQVKESKKECDVCFGQDHASASPARSSALHHNTLHDTRAHYTARRFAVHGTTRHDTTLHDAELHCTTLHSPTLDYTTLTFAVTTMFLERLRHIGFCYTTLPHSTLANTSDTTALRDATSSNCK